MKGYMIACFGILLTVAIFLIPAIPGLFVARGSDVSEPKEELISLEEHDPNGTKLTLTHPDDETEWNDLVIPTSEAEWTVNYDPNSNVFIIDGPAEGLIATLLTSFLTQRPYPRYDPNNWERMVLAEIIYDE